MFNKARLKLTLWYLLIIMLISISFSFVIYRFLTSEINRVLKIEKLRQEGLYTPRKELFVIPMQFEVPVPHKGIILAAPNPEVLEEAKQRILLMLIVINLGILGLSGAAGYLLAGLTLKPIKNMVDEQNRFITDASHELRTPLTSLKSEIEVNLRDKKFTLAGAKRLLESNLEEVNNLQYLSDNLIKLAQTHKPNGVKFQKVSLLEISNQAIKKVVKLARQKEININNRFQDLFLYGDTQSLTELLVILLDNAIKYSPKNTTITLSSTSGGNLGGCKLEIKDQGIGIDEKDIPLLFERFYRADKARNKKDADGFGLGLSIAKQIVDKHNGSINVKSETGKGTTFTIKLPLNH